MGEEAYQTLTETRLDDDPPSVKFHDKTTKKRLKTFSTISTKTSRIKCQNVVLKADRNLFSQMILVAKSRSINMKDVLSRPCPPTGPTAMSYEKQTMPHLPRSLPDPTKCGWIDGDGRLDRHSLDAVATSTRR